MSAGYQVAKFVTRVNEAEREVDVTVTEHAARRLDERQVPANLGDYRPHQRFKDGLRLWLHPDGDGLLVREDVGHDWVRLTVVTAYTADIISIKKWRNEPIVLTGLRLEAPSAAAARSERRRAEIEAHVLEAVTASPGSKMAEYAQALGLAPAIVLGALNSLKRAHLVSRSNSSRWRPLPRPATPGKDWTP